MLDDSHTPAQPQSSPSPNNTHLNKYMKQRKVLTAHDSTNKVQPDGGLNRKAKSSSASDLAGMSSPRDDMWGAIKKNVLERFSVLVLLLMLQSLSSFVLQSYEKLLSKHVEVMLFLTMLVGAGGNAGNQAAVRVIRDLAVRKANAIMSSQAMLRLMMEESICGVILGFALALVGFLRVGLFTSMSGWKESSMQITIAISISLLLIVTTSVFVGASLPLLLNTLHLDPAHAGPAVQVVMDVTGVLVTCIVCTVFLS
eukprot:TRINITY_DN3401_c0_g1_i1.p1 TRINITY_DN3401_c0_g1~~TRINITY_DN3401_c0_g1_i1.p1  ORF type:complete len:255 (+),score=77.48 TRINITY_DN3401_c0_g1_i1:63-827(+)